MGAPRPTCEGCGREELSRAAQALWNVCLNYFPLLVNSTGNGGWAVNTNGVEFLCRHLGLENRLLLARAVMTMANEAFRPPEPQTNKDMP